MNEPTSIAASSAAISNVAVVRGAVRGEPVHRTLPSGALVVQFDVVTTADDSAGLVAVPVAWSDPAPRDAAVVVDGARLVVVGVVRRRFFRVAGATQSRTELVAGSVIPERRRAQVAATLGDVAARLIA
jgi:hypothetical protein